MPARYEERDSGRDQAGPGAVKCLLLALTSPSLAFAAVRARPRYALALALVAVMTAAALCVVEASTDLRNKVLFEIERAPIEIPEEQVEEIVAQYARYRYMEPVSTLILLPVGLSLLALGGTIGIRLAGGETDYRRVLALVAHCYWPPCLVESAFSILVGLHSAPLDPRRALSPVRSNLASWLPDATGSVVRLLAESVDVFDLWVAGLLIVGLIIVAGMERFRAAVLVLLPWSAYVGVQGMLIAAVGV